MTFSGRKRQTLAGGHGGLEPGETGHQLLAGESRLRTLVEIDTTIILRGVPRWGLFGAQIDGSNPPKSACADQSYYSEPTGS